MRRCPRLFGNNAAASFTARPGRNIDARKSGGSAADRRPLPADCMAGSGYRGRRRTSVTASMTGMGTLILRSALGLQTEVGPDPAFRAIV